MKRLFCIALMGGLTTAAAAHGDTPPNPGADDLVVTATRLPTPLENEPTASILTRQDIEARQSPFAFDLLSTLPGVTTSRSGAFGGVSSVRIRGASSDKTLVLIDGVPVNDPSQPAGGYDFSGLDVLDADRIEVLEGPQGSIWGSDAIGGVIAITTREPDGLRGVLEGGSFGTIRAGASAGMADDRRAFGISAAYFDSDGISKADSRDGNTEADGFRSITLGGNARAALGEQVTVDGRIRWRKSDTDTDSFGGPTGVIDGPDSSSSQSTQGFVRARISRLFGFDQEVRIDASTLDRIERSAFAGDIYAYPADGDRINYRWTAQRSDLGPHAILLGVEHEQDWEDAGDGRQTADNTAGFAIWRFTPSQRISTTVSVRHDEPSDYSGVTTARAAATVQIGAGFALNGSWGQGYKAPSLYQRTYPCFECATPGRAGDLKPEHAQGYDATLSWRSASGATLVQGTLYRLQVREQIDYIYPNGYLNIDRTRTNGAEARLEQKLPYGLSLKASYAWADAIDRSTGQRLLRVPEHTGAATLLWTTARADAALTVRGQSRAQDVYGQIGSFVTANVAGSYAVSRNLRLTGRVENLTDTHYQEAFGYGEPGVAAYVGVRLNN